MNTLTPACSPPFVHSDVSHRPTPIPRSPGILEDVASDEFIRTMRGAATGVNVVTTDGPAGRFGLTVSAFSSVSAEPPMVLVCINHRSPACAAVRRNRRFCVNVLSESQKTIADTFAGRPTSGKAYEFDAAAWRSSVTGAPILNAGTASFDCTLENSIDAGTHCIFIGAVKAVESTSRSPLIYTVGAYHHAGSKA